MITTVALFKINISLALFGNSRRSLFLSATIKIVFAYEANKARFRSFSMEVLFRKLQKKKDIFFPLVNKEGI